VPTAEAVLSWAAGVANDWRWLAILWHVALGTLLLAMAVRRSRLSQRSVGLLLVLPTMSVAVLAALSGNPFNAAMFTILAVVLLRSAVSLARAAVTLGSGGSLLAGAALVAFGWFYPHFLTTDTWTAYAYASPFGLLPCPTLSVVIGVTLAMGGVRSTSWRGTLAAAGLLYGVIGVFGLGVVLDVGLLGGAALLSALLGADLMGPAKVPG